MKEKYRNTATLIKEIFNDDAEEADDDDNDYNPSQVNYHLV